MLFFPTIKLTRASGSMVNPLIQRKFLMLNEVYMLLTYSHLIFVAIAPLELPSIIGHLQIPAVR